MQRTRTVHARAAEQHQQAWGAGHASRAEQHRHAWGLRSRGESAACVQVVASAHDSFSVDCQELHSYSPQLYRNLEEYPREVIPILDDVLNLLAARLRAEEVAHDGGADGGGSQADGSFATHPVGTGPVINIRPYNLREPRAIRDLDPNDIEALVQVDGLVTRVSNVMPDMRCVLRLPGVRCLSL
jgi:DNA replicative helicase MCM subunit Mcm2 (Cdc46/Mcm family)